MADKVAEIAFTGWHHRAQITREPAIQAQVRLHFQASNCHGAPVFRIDRAIVCESASLRIVLSGIQAGAETMRFLSPGKQVPQLPVLL